MTTLKQLLQAQVEYNFHECSEDMKRFIVGTARSMTKTWLEQKRQQYQFGSFQYIAINELLEELKGES